MSDERAQSGSTPPNAMSAVLYLNKQAAGTAAARQFDGLAHGRDPVTGAGGHELVVLSADERGVLPNDGGTPIVNTAPTVEGSARHQLLAIRLDGDAQVDMGPRDIAKLRRAAWREHAALLAGNAPQFGQWAAEMAEVYGPAVKLWHNALDWQSAYLVARYGEDVEQWPAQLTDADVARMGDLRRNPTAAAGVILLGNRRHRNVGETVYGLDELPAAPAPVPSPTDASTAAAPLVSPPPHEFRDPALGQLADVARKNDATMSQMTDVLEGLIAGHIFRTATWGKPTALAIRLYTAMPGEAAGGTAVTGGSYADVASAPLDANWAAPNSGNGTTSNLAALTYPAPTANWGVVVGVGMLADAVLWLYGALTASKTVNNGDAAPSFPIGALQFIFA